MTIDASQTCQLSRQWSVALAAILVLGLMLRVFAARGDLWIDEIWTLDLLTTIHSPGEIFWNISHDNNHFLNTLWMYIVGLDGAPIVYRLPSIIMGTLSIAVAARIGSRSCRTAGLLAGFIVAVAFPFVNYGSEARGYAGLVLAMLVAVDALDRTIPISAAGAPVAAFDCHRRVLGLAVGLGTLSHLTMILGAGILVLGAAARLAAARPVTSVATVARRLVDIFAPACLLILPALVAVLAGIVVHGHMTIGGVSYTPGRFVKGYGGLIEAILGFPGEVPPWIALAVACAGLVAAWYARWMNGRFGMALAALGLVPATMAFANLPNTEYARYFLVCGVVFVLVMADVVAGAWSTRIGRSLVPILLAAFTIGQFALDFRLLSVGRGNVSEIVAAMANEPGTTYAAPFSTAFQLAVNYHAYRRGATIDRVALPLACARKPDWYIDDAPPDSGPSPSTVTLGFPTCSMTFAAKIDLPTSSLSGRHWTLFARQ